MNPKLLIEPLINQIAHGPALQSQKFDVSLRITNNSEHPSPEFSIEQIYLKSAQGQDIGDAFGDKSFFVGIINPQDSYIIKIGENGQFWYGLVAINIIIKPKTEGVLISLFQKNPFTEVIIEIGKNRWIDFIYIRSSSEDEQGKSTNRIMWLTWVIAFFTLIQVATIIWDHYPKNGTIPSALIVDPKLQKTLTK